MALAYEEADRIAEDEVVEVLLGTWAAAAYEEVVLAYVVEEDHKGILEGVHVDVAVAAVVVVPGRALRTKSKAIRPLHQSDVHREGYLI